MAETSLTSARCAVPIMAENPDLVAGKRLLDIAKLHGFRFQRVAPGPDGPLWGVRENRGVARHDLPRWILGARVVQRHPTAQVLI